MPAGSAKRNIGSAVAAWTSATISGEGERVVISQPAPTSAIQVPILDSTVAIQRTAKARWRNGLQARRKLPRLLWLNRPPRCASASEEAAAAQRAPERGGVGRRHAGCPYVGARAGDRILNGSIKRGDCETIDAVLWICDLENFTAVSETLSGRDLITLLDAYFDAVVGPIERHGGEVLKFMGDSVLAVFPLSDGGDQTVVHRAALAAAREGIAAVQALSRTWLARTHRPIGCGVALHVGEVSYGNIGAADRLDFTVIGPAVNLAARLEQLTRRVGTRLVLSEEFARALGETVVPLGEFALKGISKSQLVFGLPAAGREAIAVNAALSIDGGWTAH